MCSLALPCSLPGAMAVVRTRNRALTEDLHVVLRGGTYALTEPLVLGPWTLADAALGIYRAVVDPAVQTRQMYVNGVRAVRARGPLLPAGFVKTPTGFTAPDARMAAWANPSAVEFVGTNRWKSFRCDVASIAGMAVTLRGHCWAGSQAQAGYTFDTPRWIENARELLPR